MIQDLLSSKGKINMNRCYGGVAVAMRCVVGDFPLVQRARLRHDEVEVCSNWNALRLVTRRVSKVLEQGTIKRIQHDNPKIASTALEV